MKNDLILSTETTVVEGSKVIHINDVIDEFVSTKRSVNTKRAYTRDISTLFDAISVTSLNDLGRVPLFELVKQIQDHLERVTQYDKETNRPLNP